MVNKMKHLFLFLLLFIAFANSDAWAKDDGLILINTRGRIKCGTDLSANTYAYKDESGYWRGIDADLCKVFAIAILGNSEMFDMVDIKPNEASKALKQNKIDIMLGSKSYTATEEMTSEAVPVEISYYDKQVFLAKKIDGANSMQAYKGKNLCVVSNSESLFNIEVFNDKYNLDFRLLKYATLAAAKEAFLLNRCEMITATEMYLKSIPQTETIVILPETVATVPQHIFVLKNNNSLRIAAKWILNALTLAEKQDINMQNVGIWIGSKDTSTKNLLGENPQLWQKLGLKPDWLKKAIAELGNYGEIYERNLGQNSKLLIKRDKNNLLENGGLIKSQVFL